MKKEEKSRKLLHAVSGTVIPLAILFLPHFTVCLGLGIATIFYVSVEILRLNFSGFQKIFNKFFGIFLRKEEEKKLTGATWILFSALLCLLFFKKETAFIVINLSIWGDAVATIAGIKLGRVKIGRKTLEGSVSCFALCVILLIFVYPILLQAEFSSFFIIVVALSITILEIVSDFLPLDDNLVIPIITGIIISLLF